MNGATASVGSPLYAGGNVTITATGGNETLHFIDNSLSSGTDTIDIADHATLAGDFGISMKQTYVNGNPKAGSVLANTGLSFLAGRAMPWPTTRA